MSRLLRRTGVRNTRGRPEAPVPGIRLGRTGARRRLRARRPSSLQNQSMKVSMEKVVDDFANMGFTRDQVRRVIRDMTESGQGVDLNVVLDRLMNGSRR